MASGLNIVSTSILTAHCSQKAFIQAGADAVIVKPVSQSLLASTIDTLLATKAQHAYAPSSYE